jgi:hypothetical protein
MFGAYRFRGRWSAVAALVVSIAAALAHAAPTQPVTLADLKAKLTTAGDGAKPHLCLEIAEMQLTEADKLYAGAEDEKARATLTDVVTYTEMARDYAIQSRKYQKQTEIAVRGMTRKLTEVMHSLAHDDQAPVLDAVKRLQRVRDDLLTAMFPKAIR